MDLTKMTTAAVETLLHLLVELERKVLELAMQEQQEAEWQGWLH